MIEMFIADPDPGSGSWVFTHPGSRIQGSKRRRSRIRNTVRNDLLRQGWLRSNHGTIWEIPILSSSVATTRNRTRRLRLFNACLSFEKIENKSSVSCRFTVSECTFLLNAEISYRNVLGRGRFIPSNLTVFFCIFFGQARVASANGYERLLDSIPPSLIFVKGNSKLPKRFATLLLQGLLRAGRAAGGATGAGHFWAGGSAPS